MKTHELKQTLERLDERIAFTPLEIAQMLNIDRGLVYRLIAGNRILAIKIGTSCLIPRSWLDSFWRSEECGPETRPGIARKEPDYDCDYSDAQSVKEGGI